MRSPLVEIPPLAVSDCPLLAKYGGGDAERLVARFAAALEEVRLLESDRQIGPLLLAGKFAEALMPLQKIREWMTQRRYVVGCIGITQAGKSTTINNVLGEEVCKPGSGDACSSQPSRIVHADRRTLDIEYLTPSRFATRRQLLCEMIGLSTPEDDPKLLPMLDKPELFRFHDGQEPPRLKEDLAYLREFLGAYQRHTILVRNPPKELIAEPYEKRYAYTTHTRGTPGSDVLLVREARFRIDNPLIPPDLELCDLPGLDSKRSIDDIVTWEYLPELHGTFLFVNVGGNLLTEGMLRILARIHAEFQGKLAGRAWIIFNKMDTLTSDHFRQGSGQDNIFVTIGRLLEKTGIPESQICFCSKKLWDAAVEAGGVVEPALAARTMNQPTDAPIPATCPPGLHAAWRELLKDGGITNLRRLMFQDVAETLASQIRQDVDRHLGEFSAALAARVATERKRLSLNSSELQAAVTCQHVVMELKAALAMRTHEFPILLQESERLRARLAELFDTGDVSKLLDHLSTSELASQFKTHARVLNHTLELEVNGELLERIYHVIGQRLENLPSVALGRTQEPCKDLWQRFAIEDRADATWQSGLPDFASTDLVNWMNRPGSEAVDGKVYIDLMREKIDHAVRQTVHLIRTRLRSRLGQMAIELSYLTGEREAASTP